MKNLPLKGAHYLQLVRDYQHWLQTIGYADPTIQSWPIHVRELLYYLEGKGIHHIQLVKGHHTADFIRYIRQRKNQVRPGALSSSSINMIINAVNSFAKYLHDTGTYNLDITSRFLPTDISSTAVLTLAEVKNLYEATFLPHREGGAAMGQRDRAMIAVFYGCGLRRLEGIRLNLADIDLSKRLLFVRKGKGNKQRYVPIASKHAADIQAYIEEGREWFLQEHYARNYTNKFPQQKKVPDDGAFFIGQNGQRMKSFYKRLSYLSEKAGIEKSFSLHSLRHSIATHLLQSGMSLEDIARFLGHASLDSTQIYTHLVHELNKPHE